MKNLKPIKAYSVIMHNEWSKNYAFTDFLFDTKAKAKAFAGIIKADIYEVLVTPIRKL